MGQPDVVAEAEIEGEAVVEFDLLHAYPILKTLRVGDAGMVVAGLVDIRLSQIEAGLLTMGVSQDRAGGGFRWPGPLPDGERLGNMGGGVLRTCSFRRAVRC